MRRKDDRTGKFMYPFIPVRVKLSNKSNWNNLAQVHTVRGWIAIIFNVRQVAIKHSLGRILQLTQIIISN